MLLEFFVHASDVSTQTRSFDTAVEWTQLLHEEFFHQGDIEKQKSLPVSFLCDRYTTLIPQGQPAFINFILIPLFSAVSNIMPECKRLEMNARVNCDNWQNFQETPEFAKVYQKQFKRTWYNIFEEEAENIEKDKSVEFKEQRRK